MKTKSSHWVKAVQNGLLGGALSLLMCAIGLVLAFGTTDLIAGVITVGLIFALAPMMLESILTVRRIPEKNAITRLATGSLVGLLGGIILAILVLIGEYVNIRAVFINVSPDLFNLLTFNLPLVEGLIALLIISTVSGLIGAAVILLPRRFRNALAQAVLWVIAFGLFRDFIFTVIVRWGVVQNAFLWMLADTGLTIPGAVVLFLLVGGVTYWRTGIVKKELAAPRTVRQQRMIFWATWVGVAIVVLLLPIVLGPFSSEIMDNVGIYILMGLGLNIVVGFAGLLDLGYVAFYAIGAYALGVITTSESVGLLHWSFWPAVPLALLVAVLAGVVLALPVLKMRGDYLAIVTLGFGEIIRILVRSDWFTPLLGGPEGIQQIAQPTVGGFVFGDQMRIYYVILVGIIIAGFIAIRVKDSHLGRSWMALREDEDVAEAMGINKVNTKVLAFAMGALFSGLGGVLFSSKLSSVYPDDFSFIVSINILSLIIIGGMGSIPGVFVGGLVLVGMPLFLSKFTDFRYLIYGAALVFMMLVRPEGLSPEERRRLELHESKGGAPPEEPTTAVETPGK